MAEAALGWPAAIRCKANIACLQDGFLISLCQAPDRKICKYVLFGCYMQTHQLPYLPVVRNPKVISLMREKKLWPLCTKLATQRQSKY